MTKFTPEYIAQQRAEMQADERHDNEAGWISPQEFYELLDEIEKSHDMIERLIEAGTRRIQYISPDWDGYFTACVQANKDFGKFINEWRSQ